MLSLALANLSHHKFRTALVGFGVAIGVGMLVTMLALSNGTLGEVATRVQSVQADLIVLPSRSSLIFSEGAPLSDGFIEVIGKAKAGDRPLAKRVVPVFQSVMPDMAGQQQKVYGVDPSDFDVFLGRRRVLKGNVFPGGSAFKRYLAELPKNAEGAYSPEQVPEDVLVKGQEMMVDERLARAGGYRVGDSVEYLGRTFRICGIVEAGLAGRVFVPLQVIRHIQNGGMRRSSVFFVQLDDAVVAKGRPGEAEAARAAGKLSVAEAAGRIEDVTHRNVEPLEKYEQLLYDNFKSIYTYINVANGIVLLVSFLFIMVTMYTMVLERRREIGILRSLGAGRRFILGQTVAEALVISISGTAAGIVMAHVAKVVIEHVRPLLTVDIRNEWLAVAVLVGVIGGVLSALYPGYRAVRLDPVECVTNE